MDEVEPRFFEVVVGLIGDGVWMRLGPVGGVAAPVLVNEAEGGGGWGGVD